MSRKDYIAIAAVVARHIYDLNNAGIALVSELADYLQADNPNFNRERFVDACVNADLDGLDRKHRRGPLPQALMSSTAPAQQNQEGR